MTQIYSWKSNGMSEESIENKTKSGSNFATIFVHYRVLPDVNFNGHCLRNNDISILKKLINQYISYILNPLRSLNADYKLNNSLFGSVKLTKNADLHKYRYSGYGIGLDFRS